jgi:hypothetical protein
LRDDLHDTNVRMAAGQNDNQLIGRHNLLIDDVRTTLEQLDELQEARSKLLVSKSDYITATLAAADQADAAAHAYDAPAADKTLAAAIDKYNLTAKPKVKLGPSASFNEDLELVKQCRAEITSGIVPVTVDGGVPNVDVLINGKLDQTMVWDSGCSGVTLSAKTAAALGLKPEDRDEIEEAVIADSRHIKEHVKFLDSIRIGGFTVENVRVTIPDRGAEGADLLGTEFQSCFQFKLDMTRQTLQLTPLLTAKPRPDKPKTAVVAGQHTVNLLEQVSVASQTVSGTWENRDGTLCSDRGEFTRIDFNYRPPAQYDLKVTFTKLEGDDGIGNLHIPWAGGATPSAVLAKSLPRGPTTIPRPSKPGRRWRPAKPTPAWSRSARDRCRHTSTARFSVSGRPTTATWPAAPRFTGRTRWGSPRSRPAIRCRPRQSPKSTGPVSWSSPVIRSTPR